MLDAKFENLTGLSGAVSGPGGRWAAARRFAVGLGAGAADALGVACAVQVAGAGLLLR
jgi:hypothetical protein